MGERETALKDKLPSSPACFEPWGGTWRARHPTSPPTLGEMALEPPTPRAYDDLVLVADRLIMAKCQNQVQKIPH